MTYLKQLMLAGLSGLALTLTPAMAEEQAPEQQQPEQQMEVDDATLEQFAEAITEVRELGNNYSQQIAEAENQEEAQELQRQAQTEMVEAVESAGMSVQDYNTIAQQMSQDPELMERIEEMM